ncbi:MAG: hypothetical protein J5691_01135 [Bacilli bacterium]|nr:hypothetical protein [Bacilli bacterium]
MKKEVKKACDLSKMILDQVNTYTEKYTGMEGKDVTTEESLQELQTILEEGFALHNFLIEKELMKESPAIIASLINLEKFTSQLTINKENAEKLRLSNAIQVWNQTKIAIAVLAGAVLDTFEPIKKED